MSMEGRRQSSFLPLVSKKGMTGDGKDSDTDSMDSFKTESSAEIELLMQQY